MKILFQGDSITDGGRNWLEYNGLTGYNKMVADILGGEHVYVNRGVSGDTAKKLLNRYETEIKPIEPDVMSILIGINDVWRRFDANSYTSPQEYYDNLEQVILRTKADFPKVKIILIEPFLLPAPDKKHWRETLIGIIDACRALAVKYADAFIPMDGLFAKEEMTTPWEELSTDGVHPTEKGNEIIAKYLAEEIKKFI